MTEEKFRSLRLELSRILTADSRNPVLVTDDTSLLDLDSLGVVELITAAEELFGVALEFADVRKLASFADLKYAIVAKVGAP